jgi:nucleoside-diphosphate-sugar epimerase
MPAVFPSDGPVAVTGASGYIGSHVVLALVKKGYDVRACITDPSNPDKTGHLLAMNDRGLPGRLSLQQANLLDEGSYDAPFAGCSAVFHVGTVMGYGGTSRPQQVYDGAVAGTVNVANGLKKAGTVRRLIYTSSFSAVVHPSPPGYRFTEDDWASDNREDDPSWNTNDLNDKGETGYAMAKVECERLLNRLAEEDGRFDAISVCPTNVLGPLLSRVHELVHSWHWFLVRMLEGKPCLRGWQHLWNIVDVRDVGESQALMVESSVCRNGSRYLLSATDESGELSALELQAQLQRLFPEIDVGGAPDEYHQMVENIGGPIDAPHARCDLARTELGLETHAVEDTLRETARTTVDLGLVEPKLK